MPTKKLPLALSDRLRAAVTQDPAILTERTELEKTLGQDPRWLSELGIEKADLIRLSRLGYAIKARYEIKKQRKKSTGPHRIRWIIFSDALANLAWGNAYEGK
jgi:hypothetical protein